MSANGTCRSPTSTSVPGKPRLMTVPPGELTSEKELKKGRRRKEFGELRKDFVGKNRPFSISNLPTTSVQNGAETVAPK